MKLHSLVFVFLGIFLLSSAGPELRSRFSPARSCLLWTCLAGPRRVGVDFCVLLAATPSLPSISYVKNFSAMDRWCSKSYFSAANCWCPFKCKLIPQFMEIKGSPASSHPTRGQETPSVRRENTAFGLTFQRFSDFQEVQTAILLAIWKAGDPGLAH